MASKKTDKIETPDPIATPFNLMEDAGLGSLAWMGTAYAEAWSEIGREVVDFVAERVKQDVAAQQAFMQCRSLPDLQKAQTEFLTNAVAQYTAETGKLADLSAKLLPGGGQAKSHSTPL